MAVEHLVRILKLLGASVPNAQPRPGWVISTCPLGPWRHEGGIDKHPSFGVKRMTGDAKVNCFSCGFGGTITDVIHTVKHKNKLEPRIEVDWVAVQEAEIKLEDDFNLALDGPDFAEQIVTKPGPPHVFPDWWFETFPRAVDAGFAADYLAAREVPLAIAEALDLRADPSEGRVCFPVRDFHGKLMGLHGRAVSAATNPRYRMYSQAGRNNPQIWLGEERVVTTRPLVVVEGPFDLASVLRVYDNVASPLFANPNAAKIRRMGDVLEQVTFLDRGQAGDLGRQKMAAVLGADHVVTHVLPPEHRKDPGACSIVELKEVLGQVVPLNLAVTT